MPRTHEELEAAAAEVEHGLDQLDPAVLDDPASRADDLRAITSARDVIAMGERQLAMSVAAARANGRSVGGDRPVPGSDQAGGPQALRRATSRLRASRGPACDLQRDREPRGPSQWGRPARVPGLVRVWAATELGPGPKSAIVVPLDAADIERLKDRADEEGTGFTQLACWLGGSSSGSRWPGRSGAAQPSPTHPPGPTGPRRASNIPTGQQPRKQGRHRRATYGEPARAKERGQPSNCPRLRVTPARPSSVGRTPL